MNRIIPYSMIPYLIAGLISGTSYAASNPNSEIIRVMSDQKHEIRTILRAREIGAGPDTPLINPENRVPSSIPTSLQKVVPYDKDNVQDFSNHYFRDSQWNDFVNTAEKRFPTLSQKLDCPNKETHLLDATSYFVVPIPSIEYGLLLGRSVEKTLNEVPPEFRTPIQKLNSLSAASPEKRLFAVTNGSPYYLQGSCERDQDKVAASLGKNIALELGQEFIAGKISAGVSTAASYIKPRARNLAETLIGSENLGCTDKFVRKTLDRLPFTVQPTSRIGIEISRKGYGVQANLIDEFVGDQFERFSNMSKKQKMAQPDFSVLNKPFTELPYNRNRQNFTRDPTFWRPIEWRINDRKFPKTEFPKRPENIKPKTPPRNPAPPRPGKGPAPFPGDK